MTNTNQSPAGGDASVLEAVAIAICKSRTCEGVSCCQWPSNMGRIKCPVKDGCYNDAAKDAIDAYLAKLTSTKAEPCRIAEIRGFKDLFSGAYNISQSLLSAADKFEVGEINAVALFQLVRRDGELLHQIAEEAPPSKLLDDTISHITAIEAERDRLREALERKGLARAWRDGFRASVDTVKSFTTNGPQPKSWDQARDTFADILERSANNQDQRAALTPHTEIGKRLLQLFCAMNDAYARYDKTGKLEDGDDWAAKRNAYDSFASKSVHDLLSHITAIEAENAALKSSLVSTMEKAADDIRDWRKKFTETWNDNDRMREALEPFAGLPELSEAETAVPNESPVTIRCQLGDIRRAYAALNPGDQK